MMSLIQPSRIQLRNIGVGANVSTHRTANAALRAVMSLPVNTQLIVQSIAYFESGYGLVGEFAGTNNWGARTGAGDAGCYYHKDVDAYGKEYNICFSVWSTPELGARGFFKTRAWGVEPYRSRCFAAAANGDVWGVAEAMIDGGYYAGFGNVLATIDGKLLSVAKGDIPKVPVGDVNAHPPYSDSPEDRRRRINNYAVAIYRNAREVAAALGVENTLYFREGGGSGFPTGLVVAGATAAVGFWWYAYHGGKAILRNLTGLPLP